MADPAPPQTSLTTERIIGILGELDPVARKAVAASLKPKRRFPVPRTPSGGIAEAMSVDDILDAHDEVSQEEWTARAGAFYLSKVGRCFRKTWYADRGFMPDDGVLDTNSPDSKYRFDPGKSEPGHATENHIQLLMEKVYAKGGPGAVLKDIRISHALGVDVPLVEGMKAASPQEIERGVRSDTVVISGKTDILVMGDNLSVLDFMELKSPMFWPKKKSAFLRANPKTVPLSLAKVEEPSEPDGIVNFDNLLQLAIGAHILRESGRQPAKVTLLYINRERYREYIAIMLTPEEVEFLFELGLWWVTEAHLNAQSDTPPDSTFLMGYECTYCPYLNRCVADDKRLGTKRRIHEAMVGINSRLQAANGVDSPPEEEAEQPAGPHGQD